MRAADPQQERQLHLLKWKCTYEHAGCFKSMSLAHAFEDAEEQFGKPKCHFFPVGYGERRGEP